MATWRAAPSHVATVYMWPQYSPAGVTIENTLSRHHEQNIWRLPCCCGGVVRTPIRMHHSHRAAAGARFDADQCQRMHAIDTSMSCISNHNLQTLRRHTGSGRGCRGAGTRTIEVNLLQICYILYPIGGGGPEPQGLGACMRPRLVGHKALMHALGLHA